MYDTRSSKRSVAHLLPDDASSSRETTHGNPVLDIKFSRSGLRLATNANDFRIWNGYSYKEAEESRDCTKNFERKFFISEIYFI